MNQLSHQDLRDVDKRLRSALIAFFLRRTGNAAEAEDLTQEVFIRLAGSTGYQDASKDSYIFAIAANLLRDKARREAVRSNYREEKRLEDYVGVDILDPHRFATGREELAALARAIAGLPEKTRRIFTLYRIENLDKRAIAESFGLTIRSVEIHIQRAMILLVEKLDFEA